MEKATEAREKNEQGAELEAIKMSTIAAIASGDTGKVSLDNLKIELKKIPDVIEGAEVDALRGKSPWTVKAISGREYDISQYGEVADATPKPAGLYNEDGYISWEKLIEDGVISRSSTTFTVPSNKRNVLNGDLIIPDSVTSIDRRAFEGCSLLTSVKLPKGVTSIGQQAFFYCSNLTSVNIPDSVTSIGKSAFEGCSSLERINIPEGVTSIANSLFLNCNNLKNVSIPNSITSIEEWAFGVCSSLTSITIPEGVTSIGGAAFQNCSSLTTVNYTGTQEQWADITIGSSNTKLTSATINYNYSPES